MRTRNYDGRAGLFTAHLRVVGIGVAHFNDKRLQALIVAIALPCWAFVALVGAAFLVVVRKFGFHTVTNLNDGEFGRALQHGTGDQVAHALAELFVNGLAARFAHDGVNNTLGILGGNTADVVGRTVDFVEFVVVALFVGFALGNQFVHVNLARVTVDDYTRGMVVVHIQDAFVAFRK